MSAIETENRRTEAPASTVSRQYRDQISAHLELEYVRNWLLFAPDPKQVNRVAEAYLKRIVMQRLDGQIAADAVFLPTAFLMWAGLRLRTRWAS